MRQRKTGKRKRGNERTSQILTMLPRTPLWTLSLKKTTTNLERIVKSQVAAKVRGKGVEDETGLMMTPSIQMPKF